MRRSVPLDQSIAHRHLRRRRAGIRLRLTARAPSVPHRDAETHPCLATARRLQRRRPRPNVVGLRHPQRALLLRTEATPVTTSSTASAGCSELGPIVVHASPSFGIGLTQPEWPDA